MERSCCDGLRLLKKREELKQIRLKALRKNIAAGIEQTDQGQFVDGPEAFARIRKGFGTGAVARIPTERDDISFVFS
jgi:hypothetical protein